MCVGGWLLENLEQGIGRLLHEGGAGKDVYRAGRIGGQPVNALHHAAHLAQLDQQLGRVGRNDDHIRMRLDEDAGVFLIHFTQLFPRGNRFADSLSERHGESDAGAVAADSAEIGQAIGDRVLQAGHGLRQHDGESIFAGAARAGKDERGRHALSRNRLPQMADGRLISRKLIEAHVTRLAN